MKARIENIAVKTLTLRQRWRTRLDDFKMLPDKFKEKSLMASSHGLFYRAGPVNATNFAFGSYKNCEPRFHDEKRPKIPRTTCASKFEKQSKHG